MAVSSLLSPPELRADSFSPLTKFIKNDLNINGIDNAGALLSTNAKAFGPMNQYASPPVSPFDSQGQKENVTPSPNMGKGLSMQFGPSKAGVRDLPLFPSDERRPSTNSIASDQPLFPSQDSSQESQAIANHVISKHMGSSTYATLQAKPTREEYTLVTTFQPSWLDYACRDLKAWRAQEREFERRWQQGTYSRRAGQPSGVQKRQPPKKLAPAPTPRSSRPKVALPRLPPRSPRPSRAMHLTPKLQSLDSFETSPAPAGRKSSPSYKTPSKPARTTEKGKGKPKDNNFRAIPDFSPPLSTIPDDNSAKFFRCDYKANSDGQDLSMDPNYHLLHDAEKALAHQLRFQSCESYLANKRRIFQARVQALKKGKVFRKTDAQQACNVDVNKASSLWTTFDRCGWFDAKYFEQYL